MRTLSEIDINIIDGEKLSEVLGGGEEDPKSIKPAAKPLEPIFKLSWSGFSHSSDPRGGTTVLTVLGGGSEQSDAHGVTALLLPAFNPADSPAAKQNQGLSPFMRDAMRESIIHGSSHTYVASGVVHDYFLLPRNNPHFAGSFDPAAIIILSDSSVGNRSTEAYEFPPPIFELLPKEKDQRPASTEIDSLSDDLASTLESMQLADEPRRLVLPVPLWNGNSSITDGEIMRLDPEQYKLLIGSEAEIAESSYGLSGGAAWNADAEDESRHAKVSSDPFCYGRILNICTSSSHIVS